MNKKQKEVLQSQLDDEKAVIEQLKEHYKQALSDIEEKVKILSADELTQSKIYQTEFQKALKGQISTIVEQLQDKEYNTIEEYLKDCYTSGFIGTMYDIQGQGIPLIVPISQDSMVRAITLDSQISEGLYTRLGQDTSKLKKTISSEVARGISNGLRYSDISRNLSSISGIPLSNATRIARTEGHRIQVQSALDAQKEAKKKGADVVKQWDSTMDGKTRETHRKLDGQIREIDDDFEADGKKAKAPGMFGDPAEDCNCRCALLQRARWALDDSELETLKERAEYFGIDKTKDFEEYHEKYLQVSNEIENTEKYAEGERITKSINYAVDSKVIDSRAYAERFDSITDNPEVNKEILKAAKEMLHHRSGQNGEDLYLYNTAKNKWYKSTIGTQAGTPEYTKEILRGIAESNNGELLSFHNHPAGMPPSASDINSAKKNGYSKGYALCHDGTVFEYTASDEYIDESVYNLYIAKFESKNYNEYDSQMEAMKILSELYGFSFRKVE